MLPEAGTRLSIPVSIRAVRCAARGKRGRDGHTIINNTGSEVRLLVVGEASKAENRIVYPLNPDWKARRDDWWDEAPARPLGPHDGLPDRLREARARQTK